MTKTGRPKASKASFEIKSFNQNIAKSFGKAVRKIRLEKEISQENLAYISGIERSHMGRIERGESHPMLGVVVRISKGLNISPTELILSMEKILNKEE